MAAQFFNSPVFRRAILAIARFFNRQHPKAGEHKVRPYRHGDDAVEISQYSSPCVRATYGMIEPATNQQLYSLRVTGSARAITCLLKGPTIVLVSLHVQHDKAYR